MTGKQAEKQLKEGQKVRWTPDGTVGEIVERSYVGVRIHWADGQWSLYPFNDDKCPWHNVEIEK